VKAAGRLLRRPGRAWLTAGLGAWLAMGACRSIATPPPSGVPAGTSGAAENRQPAGLVRVGILLGVPRVSIGAGVEDVDVRLRTSGESAVRLVRLPRATFAEAAGGRLRLVETREDVVGATVSPSGAELLQVDATTYRGSVDVRPGAGGLTVVNVVDLEEYLRGVVPNELSPLAFPQLEALKAQAVAARTYARAHLGDHASEGYDLCATASCQVYRGQSSEHPMTDRAVAETRGIVALYRDRPIHAYYTSTCGGHTEDGAAIFDDDAPYLRGVACRPEARSQQAVRSAAPPVRVPAEAASSASVRDVSLLEALGVLEGDELDPSRLRSPSSGTELLAWSTRLKDALHRTGCEVAPSPGIVRRAGFARHVVASLCWSERAARLLAPGDADVLLAASDSARLADPAERQAMALLVHEGVLAPFPDDTLRPDAAVTRGQAMALLAGAALVAGGPPIGDGELESLADGELGVRRGERIDRFPIDPSLRLVRDLGGAHAAAAELALTIGDRVVWVVRDGRVRYLEAEQSLKGASSDRSSRYYNWEVRLTPADVAAAIARYGSVGAVRDLVPRRIGVSGRVLELAVVGSSGELVLRGLKVRGGLGLRESLFVIAREIGRGGAVERFVVTGKGWGHGVGLCQVGAFGMARAGSTYDEILRHYYTGITLSTASF
jgi:stage II sporulation protein D